MGKILFETAVAFECQSAFEIITKVALRMNINLDKDKLLKLRPIEYFIIRDEKDKDRFILLDCTGPSEIVALIVRCDLDESEEIKKMLVEEINSVESFGSEISIKGFRNMLDPNYAGESYYNKICKKYGVKEL